MRLLHSCLAAWERFWLASVPPHTLALVRIVFGGFVLLRFAEHIPHAWLEFSSATLALPVFAPDRWFTVFFAAPPPPVAMGLFACFLFAITAVTLGLWTNIAAGVSFVLYLYYYYFNISNFGTTFDRLFIFTFLVLGLTGESGATFSVDAWRRYGSWRGWRPISVLGQRLLAVQLTATYFGAGVQKLWLASWQSGEVLAYQFMGRWATAAAWPVARWNLSLWWYDRAVYAVKMLELFLPVGFWVRRFQPYAFIGGFVFHMGVTIFMGIWWFQILVPAYLLFLPPAQVHAWCVRRLGVSREPW